MKTSNIQWVFLPIALSMVVYWGGTISGGHFNPEVSLMFFLPIKNIYTILYKSNHRRFVSLALLQNEFYKMIGVKHF